ncbi:MULTISPECIES: methyltransferase domain-containing protein [unclassified Mesorhizobium]|uniref:methyltransferase domain-containing protein n=1 Tax=unclassified Mesorhizobium TaxID=325217 RepID=UPI000F76215C|nr:MULTISPECIES: methyltransferase domain-containing protein [unclassified Mesorhizobium]AZO31538.1 methyltransferase domain-containing protein [Mesorhizobium sp. M1B.F.Ca.ET.045.04.1.1]RWB22893.1 MAG: methyltransferase domain-containing protein [Mesorhizobium sp.]
MTPSLDEQHSSQRVATGTQVPKMCLVCGGRYEESRFPGLVRCKACGFVAANLDISDEELATIYGEDYFHGNEYLDYIAEEESLRLNFRNRISTLRSLVSDLADKELFEIGCAYGFFLQEVAPVVRRASGIDISADAVRSAQGERGVDAVCGDYLKFDLPRPVDIIAMWDTIEHLKRPDLFVSKAARDLRTGGILALTTGDIQSLNARLRGKKWRMIHPPTHLHYFSTATITKLLNRHGFDVIHASHPGNSRKFRSVLYYIFVLRMKRPAIYAALQKIGLFNFSITINLFDIMYIIAQRR